ncbi:hypothetical protein VTP01DRAFT_6678 [Rhizomucor pusillus]|uniref:uncharacterized protein n=1 Tax=Rhizomucor pusillus TaxID=4840 RepID=UPI003742029D
MSERGSSASRGRSISPAPHSDYEYDERHRSSRAVERTTRSISPESRTPPTRSPRRSLSRSLSPRRHGRRESPERSRDYYDDEDDDYRYRHKRSRSPREGHYHHRYRSRSRSLSRSRRSSRNTARVYFGNLSYDCRKSDLKELAREVGTVIQVEILETPSGKSKGCGVVEFSRSEYADRAIRKLNGIKFMGRPVFVREDREPEHKPVKDPKDAPEDQRLYVGNVPFSTSWQDLKDLFRKAGRVLHTDIDTNPETKQSLGSGLVIYDDPQDARAALEMMNGYVYRGRTLFVCKESEKPPPSQLHTLISRDEYKMREGHRSQGPPPRYYEDSGYHHRSSSNYHPPPPYISAPPTGLVGGPGASLPTQGPNQIFVTNLPYSTTWQDLIDLFRHVGPVVRAEILMSGGHPKGSGYVRFEEPSYCETAINKFNGYLYGGRLLDIRLDKFSSFS